ncbi:hypothetical protein BD626DRAFT_117800 [Schizophyllum amplum]|uniref:Uncharacterized protein n=1 Tax=Schizophyllum amplum TaxID=97359 RepID=A0A550CUS1_9AGAR|nr:hypothetical protein BD626DRAFT_117800 [Auriculariopsis ampla]
MPAHSATNAERGCRKSSSGTALAGPSAGTRRLVAMSRSPRRVRNFATCCWTPSALIVSVGHQIGHCWAVGGPGQSPCTFPTCLFEHFPLVSSLHACPSVADQLPGMYDTLKYRQLSFGVLAVHERQCFPAVLTERAFPRRRTPETTIRTRCKFNLHPISVHRAPLSTRSPRAFRGDCHPRHPLGLRDCLRPTSGRPYQGGLVSCTSSLPIPRRAMDAATICPRFARASPRLLRRRPSYVPRR